MQDAALFLFFIANRGSLVGAALINDGVFIRPLNLESSWLLVLESLTLLKDVVNFGLQHFLLSQSLMLPVHVDVLIVGEQGFGPFGDFHDFLGPDFLSRGLHAAFGEGGREVGPHLILRLDRLSLMA